MFENADRVGGARISLVVLALGFFFLSGPTRGQQPTPAEISAIRSSCQGDYRAHCAEAPTGGSEALACLRKNAAKLSPACLEAVNAASGASTPSAPTPSASPAASAPSASTPSTSTPGASTPAGPTSAATAPLTAVPAAPAKPAARPEAFPPMSPRQELAVLRFACGGDYRALCAGVRPGQGRAIACLRANRASLSEECKGALMGAMKR